MDATDGTEEFSATVTRMRPQGIDLEVTAASADTILVLGVVLGGEGFGMDAGSFTRTTDAAPATQSVPTKGIARAALFASVAHTSLDATQDHMRGSFGVSDGTNHHAVAWQWADAAGTSSGDTYFAADKAALVADNSTPTLEGAISAVTFEPDNLALVWNPNS